MPTFVGLIQNNQIILNSRVRVSGAQIGDQHYRSLLDTGAQRTMISPKVISEVELQPTGDGKTLPNVVHMGKDLDAFALPYQPASYDVLLGLDFVSLFHLTIYRDRYILSS